MGRTRWPPWPEPKGIMDVMQPRKTLFVAALATILLAGFMAISLISYNIASDSISEQISEETLPLTSDNIYSEIQRDLLRPILISSLMASDTFVRDWAVAGEPEPRAMINYLREIQGKYETITAFYVSDNTRSYYHSSGVLKQVDPADPADAWYFRVAGLREPYEVNVDSDTADRNRVSIFINYRVLDYKGRYIGTTGVGLAVTEVVHLIENYQRRYGRQIYFVNREGDVTLHGAGFEGSTHLRERPGMKPVATQILTSPSASITYTRPDGHEVYVNSRLVPEFGWYLLVEQTDEAGENRVNRILVINILLSLLVTAIVLGIAHFTIRGYQRRLEAMATTDKLTGIANRQMFDFIFDQQIRSLRRHQRPLSLVMFDIDDFKAVNDQFGHVGGDEVIRQVAEMAGQHVRDSDTLCRWGGEEFLLLLDDCPLVNARARAETLRIAIGDHVIRYGKDEIRVTVSLGVTDFRDGESLAALVSRADTALYRAKDRGRNRVETG